jgi:signal transduction histidine kinase
MRRQFEEVTAGRRRALQLEERYLRRDGEPVWCRTRAVWLAGPKGRPRYAVVLVQDIRDEKHTQAELRQSLDDQRQAQEALRQRDEQLRQAQKMEAIGRLAAGVAHDFNNLLTAISGYSRLLLRRLDKHSPLQREAFEISRAADKAAALTGQLLAFSRRQVLKPKILDLNAGVADLGRLLRRVIGEDIDLVTNLAEDLWLVRADPGQIQQVLMNLVVNARDACRVGARSRSRPPTPSWTTPTPRSTPACAPGRT